MKGYIMEQQQGTSEAKQLYRSKVDRIIAGVCGGFAEYFNIDPTIIRVLWLIVLFLTGIWIGLLVYLICLIVMKDNPAQSFADKKPQSTALYWGIGLVLLGLVLLSSRWDWDWFYYRPFHFHFFRPWFFNWDRFWPIIIILFGVFYLIYILRKNKESESGEVKAETVTQTGRLFRSRKDKIIGGVCGGLAKNLNIDPVIVRIAYVILTLATTIILGVIVYIIWMIVVPEETLEQQQASVTIQPEEKPVRKTPKRVKKLPDKDEKKE
jgi:phage shock protein C